MTSHILTLAHLHPHHIMTPGTAPPSVGLARRNTMPMWLRIAEKRSVSAAHRRQLHDRTGNTKCWSDRDGAAERYG